MNKFERYKKEKLLIHLMHKVVIILVIHHSGVFNFNFLLLLLYLTWLVCC
jgi:hypothetical protein